MHEVAKRLIPQIVPWITTGVVAKGKILQAGDAGGRQVRHKAGKEVEFGLPVASESPRWGRCVWDVDPWGGGRIEEARASAGRVPREFWCTRHSHTDGLRPGWLRHGDPEGAGREGVKQIGIQPKGNRAWSVAEATGATAGSERGKTEGIIGTLKTDTDGVNKPTGTSVAHAGDGRASVYSLLGT